MLQGLETILALLEDISVDIEGLGGLTQEAKAVATTGTHRLGAT